MVRGRARTAAKGNAEKIVCCLYGINRQYEVVRISVYVRGPDVRLSGPNGSHPVHASNKRTIDGWKREAALVWHLSNVKDVPDFLFGSGSEKRVYEELRGIARERNRVS